MKKQNFIFRVMTFAVGLFIMAFGVSLSVKADLGISPISCIPYVLSVRFPLTLGGFTILFNALLVGVQVVFLRKRFKLFQLVQIPMVILFGLFIDLAMFLTSGIAVSGYFPRLFLCLASCLVIGTGVFLEIRAKFTYLPGEGVALTLSDVFGIEFGKTKMDVDSSMVILGAIGSLILMGGLRGIREGTILAAVLIGYIARFLQKRMGRLSTSPSGEAGEPCRLHQCRIPPSDR